MLKINRLNPSEILDCVKFGWAVYTPKIAKEVLKVIGVAAILNGFTHLCFPGNPLAFTAIYIAPVVEEIICRGIIQGGLKAVQKKEDASIHDKKIQEKRRVRITAVIFGLAHFSNPGPLAARIFQVVFATSAGLALGYIKEREKSIVPGILLHAIHNTILVAAISGIIPAGAAIAMALILHVGLHFVASAGGFQRAAQSIIQKAKAAHQYAKSAFQYIQQKTFMPKGVMGLKVHLLPV